MSSETPRGHCTRVDARMPRQSGSNLSPTRPPADGSSAAFWPAWTHQPITRAFTLLAKDGTPILPGGGR